MLTVRHLQLKNGVYLYYRRIPEDLRAHYGGKRFIRKSLKTKELNVAARKVAELAAADDGLWASLRSPDGQQHGLTTRETREAALALLDALELSPGDGPRA